MRDGAEAWLPVRLHCGLRRGPALIAGSASAFRQFVGHGRHGWRRARWCGNDVFAPHENARNPFPGAGIDYSCDDVTMPVICPILLATREHDSDRGGSDPAPTTNWVYWHSFASSARKFVCSARHPLAV